MLQKRTDHEDESPDRSGEMLALETARSTSESSGEKATEPKKDEEHVSMFWRIFGGTILSIVALVSITLYNNISSSISELRAEVSREREARAELVKKEEFNTRVTAQYERMRAIDAVKVELEGLKEKVHTNATSLDGVRRDTTTAVDSVKKDTDAMKKDVAALEALKEKLGTAAADLKSIRDEVMKLSAEVERNKASDLERKTARDSQYKHVEDTLKEVQRGLQDCREKLARLEGSQPKPGDVPLPFGRPTPPSSAKPSAPATPSEVKPAGGTAAPGTTKPAPPDDE